MRILMITAEGPPLHRTGAIIDMLEALPRDLRARGHEVSVVLPFYREIHDDAAFETRNTGVTVDVKVGEKNYIAEFYEGHTATGVQVFLVRSDELFDRAGIYGEDDEQYEDNASRFIFFNRAAVELARRLTPVPEILHAHDWAASLVPVFARSAGLPFANVLTIHDINEQGSFWGLDFGLTNLPQRYFTLHGIEFFGRVNFLKGGILYADRITTASEHFKREILRPGAADKLDIVLRENAYKLRSILHGADYTRWNPETDTLLPVNYSASNLVGKRLCRDALLTAMNLAPNPRGPMFGMVTQRATEQGFDILLPTLDRMLSDDVRLIILGEADPAFETALAVAARKYPAKLAYRKQNDDRLAHLITAGADVTLIPSRIEPSGLSAMHSLKYGTLPVARAAGGIRDIIDEYDRVLDRGYGFLCFAGTANAFWDSIKWAREVFTDQATWATLMQRAMARDFSWEDAASQYEQVYRETLNASGAIAA
jgi:starch synthase